MAIATTKRKYFTRTRAAKILRKNPQTLISWELRGIVTPKRNKSGYRLYTQTQLNTLKIRLKKNNGRIYSEF